MEKSRSVKWIKILLLWMVTATLLLSSNQLERVVVTKGELQLTFAQPIKSKYIHHFRLQNPNREVYDFTHMRLKPRAIRGSQRLGNGLKLRIAQRKKDAVRLVIESRKPYRSIPYQPLFTASKYHIPLPERSRSHHTTTPKAVHPKRASIMEEIGVTPRRHSRGGERIVIDAGHGGHDSGAVGGGKREKDLVLKIAKRLERQLKSRGYRVFMTRRSDRFLKLPERTQIADRKDAKLFISIHANSVKRRKRNKVHGVETFFLQKTRDAKSQRIAARENKAVLKGAGSRLSKRVIIDSVLSGPKIVESNKLAIDVQRGMMKNLHSRYPMVRDGGVRHAPFWVLVGASRPSILVEVGYISNPVERKRLFLPRYQNLLTKGIADGIDNYFSNRKREIDL